MASWAEFERAAPAIAAAGHGALFRGGASEAFLTTVPGPGLPRMHVVNVGIVSGRLLVFAQGHSAKAKDLTTDGRYALHAFQDPIVPDEFLVRGRAVPIADGELRAQAVAAWPFSPADDYPLFELDIAHAILGARPTADDWPPKYASWRPE
jgi:pyridoxamine 5'-phosphate oxidase-like protein